MHVERFVERIQKGNIYCVAARPFVDKAEFCVSAAVLFASKGNKVLYMSHNMDEDAFIAKLNTSCPGADDNIEFLEMFKITMEGLEMFADDDYDLMVFDPFDIYSLDLDVGDLKEFAKKKNIAILLTTNLARPPFEEDRIHPVLSDMKFVDEKTYKKLLAFSDIILFISQEPDTNHFEALVGKDAHGEVGITIDFKR